MGPALFCILQDILDRTGYSLEITSGQRKYGGPPPDYVGPTPGAGHEVSLKYYLALAFYIAYWKFFNCIMMEL